MFKLKARAKRFVVKRNRKPKIPRNFILSSLFNEIEKVFPLCFDSSLFFEYFDLIAKIYSNTVNFLRIFAQFIYVATKVIKI